MIDVVIEGIFKGSGNDLFLKVYGNECTLRVGILFIVGHGNSSGMDSIEMCIPIIDCRSCSSVLNVEMDFFYRFNEKISRSAAIGCIAFVMLF